MCDGSEAKKKGRMCDAGGPHLFSYAGVRFYDGSRPRPGGSASTRYYAHVYFCTKCTRTRSEFIQGNDEFHTMQPIRFNATPGAAEQCGVPDGDR